MAEWPKRRMIANDLNGRCQLCGYCARSRALPGIVHTTAAGTAVRKAAGTAAGTVPATVPTTAAGTAVGTAVGTVAGTGRATVPTSAAGTSVCTVVSTAAGTVLATVPATAAGPAVGTPVGTAAGTVLTVLHCLLERLGSSETFFKWSSLPLDYLPSADGHTASNAPDLF